ncbi:transmembrane protein 198-like [Saccostrea cucullata]|uniref:transmembrane protein 198-like n=1 Tax=Saccostrea cuccullata TaxID=36930 RepID=UPI002ED3267A
MSTNSFGAPRAMPPATPSQTYETIMPSTEGINTTTPGERVIARPRTCDEISAEYDIALAVICSMCFIFGIVYTFFGYRFFKAVMFLTGFIFTSVLAYLILSQHSLLPMEGNIGVALGAGLLIGLVTMLVQYVGLFFTGFQLGAALGVVSLIIVDFFVIIPIHWIRIGVICGLGLVCAIVTLKFQKGGMILGTSVFGGALMVACLDYFIEQFAMVTFVWGQVTGVSSGLVCWYSWVLLGCWPFCFLVGAVTQWRITGQGYDHNEVLPSKRVKKANLHQARKKERVDSQHTRYRHLYQARRAPGDVLSQTYIQTMTQKMSPATKRKDHIAIPTEPSLTELDSTNTTLTQVP